MASSGDNSQIDVDIILDDVTLNASLARTAQGVREAVAAARGLTDQFAATVRSVDPLLTMVTKLKTELAATRDQGGLQSGLRDQLRQAEADLRSATAALTAARSAASTPTPAPAPAPTPGLGAGGQGSGGLFPLQAQIAANYATIGAGITVLRAGLKDIAEFDDKLRQFQAITETTNTEMGAFRDQLLEHFRFNLVRILLR